MSKGKRDTLKSQILSDSLSEGGSFRTRTNLYGQALEFLF
jgi:hypothetical protein